jgi:hypothetical protein
MKRTHLILALAGGLAAALFVGCASTKSGPAASEGVVYKKDKEVQEVWLADQFDFSGYDTVYVAETRLEAKPHNKEEEKLLEWVKPHLREELLLALQATGVFRSIVTNEADIKSGSRTLKMENTIVEYEKGGGGARYFAGMYGAGQPLIKLRGKITEGEKPVCQFQMRRSGESGYARVFGAYRSDQAIQNEDIHDLAIDFASFVSRTCKRASK